MVQSVEHPTIGFGLGGSLSVVRSNPALGSTPSALCLRCSLSLCPLPTVLSLSLSWILKKKKKVMTWWYVKLPELMSEFNKVAEQRSIYKNQLYSYILTVNNWKLKWKGNTIIASKNVKCLGINLTKMWETCTLKTTKGCQKK